MNKLLPALVVMFLVSVGPALARGGGGMNGYVRCNLTGCNAKPPGVNPNGPYYPGPFETLFGLGKWRRTDQVRTPSMPEAAESSSSKAR